MQLKLPKLFLYLLGIILVINLVQAYFTELIFDEAYYWYYAQKMAWGYFDHPPMVAWLIQLSNLFFNGELGVRFMSCLLSIGTLTVLWSMIDAQKKKEYVLHFFVLAFSMTLLNVYGFFTLPDTPLLFFTALFLWGYKRFIASPSFLSAILLGVIMAALMYSKYHAVLIIVFVLLSNLKLVTNKYAWVSVVVALLCYTPHFMWLLENDFVSIKYHISERPNQAYSFEKFTLGYFLNLIALFGFTFPFIYWSLFRTKASDAFTKALLYVTYGVLLFFFISSFQRRVQTQWVIIICIPLLVIAYNFMLENKTARTWIFRLGIVNSIIFLVLRIGLVYKPLFPVYYESHGNKKWVNELKSQVGDTPVVFENSYRRAPMYAFYSGNRESVSINNVHYRQNQYTIDDSESKVQHKKVIYVSPYLSTKDVSYTKVDGTQIFGMYIDNFESFRKLRCFTDNKPIVFDTEQQHLLKVYNPYSATIDLEKIKFGIIYLNDYKQVKEVVPAKAMPQDATILSLKPNDTTYFKFTLPKTKMENPGYFKIGISENGLHYGLNSQNIKFE